MIATQLSIDLFPASGLDNSLFTAVLLGLLCVFLLKESYGWIFTGLVVPGYLASVFVIQPLSGAVIVGEALVTYLVARGVSDHLSRVLPYHRFFGRERFFLILLCSVAVRLVGEALVLPAAAGALSARGLAPPDLVANLFSIGLIVVPLTANAMWKTGIGGWPQVAVPTAAVYLALRLVLIPHTNLSISDFELTYENVALGFVASPKTYIILLTAAYLAARNNIAWGWDSNGIVVLALVALAWLSPLKVLTTVVEVMLLVFVARMVLALPVLATANIEGPRRVVLVFGLGFAMKFLGCHLLAAGYPGLKATDYFGFGYLLPSLLALKILQKGNAAVILMPTLQTSAVALALGSIIGLTLALLRPEGVEPWLGRDVRPDAVEAGPGVVGLAHLASGRVLAARPPGARGVASRAGLRAYRELVADLVGASGGGWEERQARARTLGLTLWPTRDPRALEEFWILEEPSGPLSALHGWGFVAVREDAPTGLVVEVPYPLSEPGALVCGALAFRDLGARALVVSGTEPGDPDRFVRREGADLPLSQARRALAGYPTLEVRAPPREGRSVLWVSGDIPAAVDLNLLRRLAGGLELAFADPPGDDGYARPPQGRRVQLDLSRDGALRARAEAYPPRPSRRRAREVDHGLAALATQEWFRERIQSVGYSPPSQSDLAFVERELLVPLMRGADLVQNDARQLAYLDGVAALVGYGVELVRLGDGAAVLLLAETPPAVRGWGAVLVRPSADTARYLAVPRPGLETHTLDLALHLARELDAQSMVIAGARPDAAVDGSADVLRPGNDGTLFAVFHRLIVRESPQDLVPFGLQVRGFSSGRPLDAPAVLATGLLTGGIEHQDPALARVAGRLGRIGVRVRMHDGSLAMAQMRGYGIPQLRLARDLDAAPYAVLWASPDLRRRVSQETAAELERVAVGAGLRPRPVWLEERWGRVVPETAVVTPALLSPLPRGIPDDLARCLQLAAAMMRTGDRRYLGDLVRHARARGIEVDWWRDGGSGMPVLWLRRGGMAAAVNPMAPYPGWAAGVEDDVAALRVGMVPLLLVEGM